MEERELDLDDSADGKIRLRKNRGILPAEEGSPDEIIVDVPDFPLPQDKAGEGAAGGATVVPPAGGEAG